MSDEVKPAMTAAEWARLGAEFGRYTVSLHRYGHDTDSEYKGSELQVCSDISQALGTWNHVPDELMHQAAALALHGQPFGFTWDDVDNLRATAEDCLERARQGSHAYFIDLADRIAALLPPRG